MAADEEKWLNICAVEHAVIYGQLKGNYIELIAVICGKSYKEWWVVGVSLQKRLFQFAINGMELWAIVCLCVCCNVLARIQK